MIHLFPTFLFWLRAWRKIHAFSFLQPGMEDTAPTFPTRVEWSGSGRNSALWISARGFGGGSEDAFVTGRRGRHETRYRLRLTLNPHLLKGAKGAAPRRRADQPKGLSREIAKPCVSSWAGPSGATTMSSSQRRPNSPGM